jgi:inhibitor of cysteine peptidase
MLQFDASSNGSEREVKTGEKFEIVLRENPTTGFRWHLVSNGEPACTLLDNSFEPGKSRDKSGNPAWGAGNETGKGGDHSWQFQAVQPGLVKIEFVYRRSWEQAAPPAQSFTLTVHVRA